ncbi:hypothetical protein RclHR1_02050028 [Rhizophagus clarus]|uniref:Uncharacterized protein n=1 Tax=Rhizophagus clarus TaxID=94130 RepID=A0A2Z6QTG2_9GLOM|nr:hypothetical protein RclHR1_02050028 [Rhizophagus clarus]
MENLENPMHQSDMLINVDMIDGDLKGLLDDESLSATFPRNNTPLPVTSLTKSQKRNAKKKAQRSPCDYKLLLD